MLQYIVITTVIVTTITNAKFLKENRRPGCPLRAFSAHRKAAS
jgi:hypothetical protein